MSPSSSLSRTQRSRPRPLWTEDMDNLFIDVLLEARVQDNFAAHGNPVHAIRVAMTRVNSVFNTTLDEKSARAHFHVLKHRHLMCTWARNLSGVCYDGESGQFQIAAPTWELIMKDRPYVERLLRRGEKRADDLDTLFAE